MQDIVNILNAVFVAGIILLAFINKIKTRFLILAGSLILLLQIVLRYVLSVYNIGFLANLILAILLISGYFLLFLGFRRGIK